VAKWAQKQPPPPASSESATQCGKAFESDSCRIHPIVPASAGVNRFLCPGWADGYIAPGYSSHVYDGTDNYPMREIEAAASTLKVDRKRLPWC